MSSPKIVRSLQAQALIPSYASISDGRDNGANDCMVLAFENNPMRHRSTEQAINNLLSRANHDCHLQLAGHGNVGSMELGHGQLGWSMRSSLSVWTVEAWAPHFARLKSRNVSLLSLYSCSTGAGDDGADLLWWIAMKTNTRVRARTGLSYCGRGAITFQKGSQWQEATPHSRPRPIPLPERLIKVDRDKIFMSDDSKSVFERTSNTVQGLKVTVFGPTESFQVTIPEDIARDVAAVVFNDSIEELPGQVLGLQTLLLEFLIDTGSTIETVSLFVYNDDVAVDHARNTMFTLPFYFRQMLGV